MWLDEMMYNWLALFNNTCIAGTGCNGDTGPYEALEVAMFFANEAWLRQTATLTTTYTARSIYNSPGSAVIRPFMARGAAVAISLLISLQVLSLLLLGIWIYVVPTWITKLDSYAMAQLVKNVEGDIFSGIGYADEQSLRRLQDVDGLVGVVEQDELQSATEMPESEDLTLSAPSSGLRLARGAPNSINRRLVPSKRTKRKRR
ncbi:hypothetical protein LTR37_016708 [Vermiconidia calcicola]|uniref:Uncharacterized protein n=1 Tax=Vermiconidia calcicola TaxID=1690605 RepID=A0ACC3MPT0_9PEZI|nr:hypothetical protein LTR37_016708 [Vermiconidia calcicola]